MIQKRVKPKNQRVSQSRKPQKTLVGWREWASLPGLRISRIKAKIDTGAKTSALHASELVTVQRSTGTFVRFKVHPLQRNMRKSVDCELPLKEWRHVTDSGGKRTLRPVVETIIELGGRKILAEITLIARDAMGFRMLIGRQALKNLWIVDSSKSFIADRQSEVGPILHRAKSEEEE